MTYSDLRKNGSASNPNIHQGGSPGSENPKSADQQGIPVDGFLQVIEMLKVADPAFRESILSRLAARDPALAREIKKQLL
jgi:hypothetical protein